MGVEAARARDMGDCRFLTSYPRFYTLYPQNQLLFGEKRAAFKQPFHIVIHKLWKSREMLVQALLGRGGGPDA
jgi:hypothetical protein